MSALWSFIKPFLRDEMIAKFLWAVSAQIDTSPSHISYHIITYWKKNDFDMRLEVLTKVLVRNFPHVRVKLIIWSAARSEPWDRSRMDGRVHFSFTDAGHYCKDIFRVIFFVWTQSDENDSLSFCIRNHYWDSRV